MHLKAVAVWSLSAPYLALELIDTMAVTDGPFVGGGAC